MKKAGFVFGLQAMALVCGLLLAGCEDPLRPEYNNNGSSAPGGPDSTPVSIINAAVEGGNRALFVSWTSPAESEGFDIFCSQGSQMPETAAISVGPTETSCLISGLANDTAYNVWVKGKTNGAVSNAVMATTFVAVPSARYETADGIFEVQGARITKYATGQNGQLSIVYAGKIVNSRNYWSAFNYHYMVFATTIRITDSGTSGFVINGHCSLDIAISEEAGSAIKIWEEAARPFVDTGAMANVDGYVVWFQAAYPRIYSSHPQDVMIASAPSYTLGSLPEYPPTQAGYAFKGWYADATDVSMIEPDSTISGNTIVYGRWTLLDNAQLRIDTHPQGKNYEPNATATALFVRASAIGGGTLSYQWYSNTTDSNSGGTAITGATGESWTPPTDVMGTFYYYVVVTNTNNEVNGEKTASVVSSTARILVDNLVHAASPLITVQPAGARYDYNATATPLSVTAASPDGGTLSYMWYKDGSTVHYGSTYTPPTYTVGTFNYYVVVTNTNNTVNGERTAQATSAVATIVVTDKTDLNTAITNAEAALAAVWGGTPDTSTSNGTRYVTGAQAASYQSAISAAQVVNANSEATMAAIDQSLADLNAATTTFNSAIQTWTVSTTALNTAIRNLQNLQTWLNGVAIGDAAASVHIGTHYLTNAQKTALQDIINAAIAVRDSAVRTGAEVTAQESALAAADTNYRGLYNGQIGTSWPGTINGNTITADSSATAEDVAAALTFYLASASGGESPANPVRVKINVTSLSQLTYGTDGIGILYMANTDLKYVSYDLSDSALTSIGGISSERAPKSKVVSITLPNSLTTISNYLFYGFSGLTSVTIPNGVSSIGTSAFRGCSSLTAVTIPNSVTDIKAWAFHGCTSLTSVTIPNGVSSIGNYAFSNCSRLTSITVDSGNTNYKSIDGVLFNAAGTTLMQYPAGKTGTTYTIANSVSTIANGAFGGCSGLISLTIPNNVTDIGTAAFRDCSSLASITIPDSVTYIKGDTFSGCSSLTSVTIPSSVTLIGSWVFSGCSSLTSVIMRSSTPPELHVNAFLNTPASFRIKVASGLLAAYTTNNTQPGWTYYYSADYSGNYNYKTRVVAE